MTDAIDYEGLGFRCGLEIHQQLATGKLFCRCSTDERTLDDEAPDFRFTRRLRPTQSELGEVDAAARAEAERSRRFEYVGFHGLSCLVEADEEPPHPANDAALDVALTMGLLFGSRLVDEVEWMRKIVIDGSNTSGFQRTGLVALGGSVDGIGIQTVALEEDSARRVGEGDGVVRFGLDRLGIPLIEVATDPDIKDAAHARVVAARLGALLRATGKAKRGIGTIRQDLNVSIKGGTRVEVKGVQELNAIPRVIDHEVRRQRRLIDVAAQLKERGVTADDLDPVPVDVTELFAKTGSKVVSGVLTRKGRVQAAGLKGMAGLLGSKEKTDPRLGRELADHARQAAGVRGLLHGDELPTLGISQAEVDAVRRTLDLGDEDSLVLVAAPKAQGERAIKAAVERARAALGGVLPEVRQAYPDDTNGFLRPMPGAARMYPETDVPPVAVTQGRVDRLKASLPEAPEVRVKRLITTHGLSKELAQQAVDEGVDERVAALAEAVGDATLAARTLLATVPEVRREHDGAAIDDALLAEVLTAVRQGAFAKEGIPQVLAARATGKAPDLASAIDALGLGGADADAVRQAATRLVAEREAFVRERAEASVGPLMGVLMKEFRGKVDGQLVSQALAEAVQDLLAKN